LPQSIASAKRLARANVPLLRRLVAATEQNYQRPLSPCEIDSIGSTDIDSHFADSIAKRTSIANIAQAGGIQTSEYASLGANISSFNSHCSKASVC
jgi:hypothetical protein